MTTDLHPDDIALLERLGAIAEIVDPVPEEVLALGRAAFALHHADVALMRMATEELAGADLRTAASAARGTSRLHVFEHGGVSLELDVTSKGDFARILGVVVDESGAPVEDMRVVLETASTSRTVDLEDERFTFERVPLGLARVALERGGERSLSTTWFDVG
jgi:hypothetical protein